MARGDCDWEYWVAGGDGDDEKHGATSLPLLGWGREGAPPAENKGTIYYFRLTFLWLRRGERTVLCCSMPAFDTVWL